MVTDVDEEEMKKRLKLLEEEEEETDSDEEVEDDDGLVAPKGLDEEMDQEEARTKEAKETNGKEVEEDGD